MPPRSTKIFNQHVAAVYCTKREFCSDEWQDFALKNSETCSTLENTTYIVWFKGNQSVEFFVQSVDFTWLKWNQWIEK